jgi:hypothetical protein
MQYTDISECLASFIIRALGLAFFLMSFNRLWNYGALHNTIHWLPHWLVLGKWFPWFWWKIACCRSFKNIILVNLVVFDLREWSGIFPCWRLLTFGPYKWLPIGIPQLLLISERFCSRGFPIHSVQCTETHVHLLVKCQLLLSDFSHNWNVLTNFSETSQYHISLNFCQLFSNCCTHVDKQKMVWARSEDQMWTQYVPVYNRLRE